jgi:flagellar motor switch protein FliN/FliY
VTTQEALQALAVTTAAAFAEALSMVAGEEVTTAEVTVPLPGPDPLEGVAAPAVMVVADYAGGTQGGNVFALPATVAARLAALDEDADFGDDDLPALQDAMGRAMSAIAAATGQALGEDVAIEVPELRLVRSGNDLKVGTPSAVRTTVAVLNVLGEPCRLVGLVPTVFTMRLTQAMTSGAVQTGGEAHAAVRAALRDVPLRVWAELGRARLRTVEVASLGDGAIVDLDRAAEDPVDIYVNGSRIATGRLICVDETDWAVRLEEVFTTAEATTPTEGPH